MTNTLTQVTKRYGNRITETFNPQYEEGVRWLGYQVIHRLLSASTELLKIEAIALDILCGLLAIPSVILTLGVNPALYSGVTKQLKQGEELIPALLLFFVRPLFIPSFNLEMTTLTYSTQHIDNPSKIWKKWGKGVHHIIDNWGGKGVKGLIIRETLPRIIFLNVYLLSAALRILQLVQGIFFLFKSIYSKNREEDFQLSLRAFNAGGILNDLFKAGIKTLNPRSGPPLHF